MGFVFVFHTSIILESRGPLLERLVARGDGGDIFILVHHELDKDTSSPTTGTLHLPGRSDYSRIVAVLESGKHLQRLIVTMVQQWSTLNRGYP